MAYNPYQTYPKCAECGIRLDLPSYEHMSYCSQRVKKAKELHRVTYRDGNEIKTLEFEHPELAASAAPLSPDARARVFVDNLTRNARNLIKVERIR